jgi:O-antigen ligase
MLRATWIWAHTGATDHFFYHALLEGGVTEANAVYMSWYTLFALIALIHWPIGAQTVLRSRLRMLLFLFLNTFAILLASRLLVVLLLFVDASAFYKVIRERRHFMRNLRLGVLSCILLFLFLFLTNNPVSSRFREIRYSAEDLSASKKPLRGTEMRFDNLSLRLFLWRNGLKTVQVEHLWLQGTGAGDYTEAQKRRIMELTAEGYNLKKHESLWKINLHNTYIQALVMYGIPGLLLLFGMLVPPLLFRRRHGISNVFVGLIMLSIAFMMQESVLQTQAGIVFLSLFSSVLWNFNYNWLAGRRKTVAKTLKMR